MRIKQLLVVLCLGLFVTSCTTRLTDFTVLSSKNVDLSQMGKYERGKDRVEGEDIAHIILFIPTGMPNLKEAIDRAIEATPGCVALADGVVSSRAFWFLVYGQNAYIVEGSPIIDPSLVSADEIESNFAVVKYDEETEQFVHEYVTESEYNELKAESAGE